MRRAAANFLGTLNSRGPGVDTRSTGFASPASAKKMMPISRTPKRKGKTA